MKRAVNKDDSTKREKLGQYNTSLECTDSIISELSGVEKDTLFIEPSFGSGNFIKSINKSHNNQIIGVEIDEELFTEFNESNSDDKIKTYNLNFYDFNLKDQDLSGISNIQIVGNPPYRTPALSLSNRKKEISYLKEKYNIGGVKEESVFFIVKTFDVISDLGKEVDIHYILPKTIFQNPTKAFKTFYNFLNKNLNIVSVKDVSSDCFDNVSQNLILVHFSNTKKTDEIDYNGESIKTSDFLGSNDSIIPYNQIFKKTYLGSVPAESFLLSCRDESLEEFMGRLRNIFFDETNLDNLLEKLSHNGKPHLSNINDNKIRTVLSYIDEIKNGDYDLNIFLDESNYKRIKHRNEYRWYLRHDSLKKVSFVYLINSKPCESFYFTSNPTSISTDYYGYTNYDANRNSSPGSIRLVPIEGLEDNLTDDFKEYWTTNTNLPYTGLFEYMIYIYKSSWYKEIKKTYGKFYFGVPVDFLEGFIIEKGS
jgi:hypothetical protein